MSASPCTLLVAPPPTPPRRNGLNIITKSLARVAKKAQPEDIEGFTKTVMNNIQTTTDP
jgi:hypothetical protein